MRDSLQVIPSDDEALRLIDEFIHLTDQVGIDTAPGITFFGTTMRGDVGQISQAAYKVERILDLLFPRWRFDVEAGGNNYKFTRKKAEHARVEIEEGTLLRLRNEREGLDAEIVPAGLHPWVWNAASGLWSQSFYMHAILESAKQIVTECQRKLVRFDLSEADLFAQAFSLADPKEGSPRLRLMEDNGGDTYKNVHKGAIALAQGLFWGIRNPGSHHTDQPIDKQVALEQLAAFSVLARWVDQAQVVRTASFLDK